MAIGVAEICGTTNAGHCSCGLKMPIPGAHQWAIVVMRSASTVPQKFGSTDQLALTTRRYKLIELSSPSSIFYTLSGLESKKPQLMSLDNII